MLRKLSLYLSLAFMLLFCTVGIRAYAADDGVVIDESETAVTLSLYKFKSGEKFREYVERVVKATDDTTVSYTLGDTSVEARCVKTVGNRKYVVTFLFRISSGENYASNRLLIPQNAFQKGTAYSCKVEVKSLTNYSNKEFNWPYTTIIPREGEDCITLPMSPIRVNTGESFNYSYKLAKSKDQGECTLDLTVGDVEYKSDEEKVIAERIVNALNAAADAGRIGSQVKKYTSSGSQVVEMSFDMDRDNKYDFTVTKYDNYYVFSELYALTDSPGWTLKLTGEEKQALDETGSEYYSTVYIYMYELQYNMGELSIDFNKGDFLFNLNNDTQYAYALFLYDTLVLASDRGNYGLPEQISFSDQKVSEGNLVFYNLNSNDDKYDIAVAIKNNKLIISQLDTCDCGDEFALELNEKAKKFAENDGDGYYTPLKFKFKKQASETSEQNKQEESAKKQEETQKVEDPVAETEVTLNNATYKIDGENATLSTASTTTGNFSVPANVTIGGKSYAVTRIANNAFKGSAIKSLTIGNSITEIGDSAFTGCKNLTKVTIGKNVAKIGKKAFFNCPKLKKVTFKGQKVKKIGSKAFKKIKKGASFKVPKKSIPSYTKLLKGKRDNGSKITK
ncbi:leucine-rich repeat domain-containing protein [Butyrivibrio sp. WCD3002]|uniref:leucine-rich repeat domain-containing protein n=1 Tax=Butyrivibrio sp. WCD3002 TaxID=1280676 RepID=UPI000479F81A|nr:leucine-rich repeat domain-containing protein [Butyrivibrio sp. WCD3002]